MTSVAINGAAGKMGTALVRAISKMKTIKLKIALEHQRHADLGKDSGVLAGLPNGNGVILSATPNDKVDILIDFSNPAGAMNALKYCVKSRTAFLSGTTGLNSGQLLKIKRASKKIACLSSSNMSPGAAIMFQLAPEIASKLGSEYDIEIIEMHHRFKKDAPSGTALRLANNIKLQTKKEVPIHSLRIGDIVGDHSIIFSNLGERIELTHRAHTREVFCQGALRASLFLAKAKPGQYTMNDVINQKNNKNIDKA